MTNAQREQVREGWPAGLVAGLVFLLAVMVILVILRFDGGRDPLVERVGERDVLAFEDAVASDLTPVELRPTDRLRVRGSRVEWLDDAGAPWVSAPTVLFTVRLGGALDRVVVIEDGVAESPRLRLVQRGPGVWNYDAPLARLLDPDRPAADPPWEITLRNTLVRNGQVTLERAGEVYRARDVRLLLATVELAGPRITEPRLHIPEGEATLVLQGPEGDEFTQRMTVGETRLRIPDGTLVFDVSRLTFGTSVFAGLSGLWDPGMGGFGLLATGTIERLALVDLPWLRVESPEDAVASGSFRVEPLPGERSRIAISGLTLRSQTSAASGSMRFVWGPDAFALEQVDLTLDPLALSLVEAFTGPLPYVGDLRGTVRGDAAELTFDLRAQLATSPGAERFAVDLRGQAALTDVGLEIGRVTADLLDVPIAALQPLAPGLPFRGVAAGTVVLEGLPGEAPLRLDMRLELGGGIVTVAGTVDLRDALPRYDLSGRLVAVDLRRVLEPPVPPVQLHAGFALSGVGVTPETARAGLRLDGRPTGWHTVPGDTVVLNVRVAEGLLLADEVRMDAGPVQFEAAGDWRFALGTGGALRYSLIVDSLEPLGPYLPAPSDRPLFARGALSATGTVEGSLEAPLLRGSVRAADFRYGDWAASSLQADYEARLGPGLPQVVADGEASNVLTPGGDFERASLAVDFTRPHFDVRFDGLRAGGAGVARLEADGVMDDAEIQELVLRTVELDLEGRRWRLQAPARVERLAGDMVRVTGFRLDEADGDGVLLVDGVVAPLDAVDMDVEVAALPVGDLLALVRADLALAGQLWLRGNVQGPAAAPNLVADLQLVDGGIRDVPVEQLTAFVRYEAETLTLVGAGVVGDASRFDVEASVPMELMLGLPPSFELVAERAIVAEVRTEEFDLAGLDAGIPAVRDLAGHLTANLSLAGTPMDPVLSGEAVLRGGAVTVRILGQHYRDIEGEATLEGAVLSLTRLDAWAGGPATLTGTIRFEDLANPVLDLTADMQRFRAQGVQGRRDAAVSGRITIGGTPLEPVIAGSLLVEDGTLDLARIQPTGALSDDIIGIAEPFAPLGPADFDLLEPEGTGVIIPRLDVAIANDVWFQTNEFRIQLGGDLIVQKPAEDVMVTGTLTGDRGTFNLRIGPATRRFEIVQASIQFFGNPGPDPALDITAARIIPGPNRTDFELRTRLTGTLSSPAVAFATADGTSIPEAEALNFLVFGRATATLADFAGAGFGTTQSVYDALAFYGAFDWVSAALAEQFGAGIDYFQIVVRTGTADFGPEFSFLLGHEVVDDIFVLVSLPTTEFEARWAVTAEWRIDRQWTLEAGYEPPDLVIGVPGRRLPFALERDQQLFMSLRRRWTY